VASNSTEPTDPPQTPARKRGAAAFLFRTPLGCALTALLVLLAIVAVAPSFLGGFATNTAQQAFANRFRGSLAVEGASLSWFGEQRVEKAVLRDPDGRDVARVSLTLPSLASLIGARNGSVGRVVVSVDADLVQDDAGVTNLQRAIAPREPETNEPEVPDPDTAAATDPFEFLRRLDLELIVESKRLTWSDAETRRLGIPFEVRDLSARVTAMPGAPIDVRLDGRLVSEQPGALHASARVNWADAASVAKNAWPLGKIDAQVEVEGFSTAMIDGVAELRGNLKELLGNRFTLKASAKGATLDAGDVSLTLNGERASLALSGRFEDGAFRSTTEPGLVATFPAPRGFLKQYVDPQLPPGTVLAIDADSGNVFEPWVVRATRFAVPLPPSGAHDLATLRPTLEKAQLDALVTIPGTIAFENETTRAARVSTSVRGLHVEAHTSPGGPLSLHVDAQLDAGTPGSVTLDVAARDAWAKLAAGALPIVDVQASVTGLSSATVGALAGQGERLSAAIGDVVELELDAREVSLDGGLLDVSIVGRDTRAPREADSNAPRERLVLKAKARVAGGTVRVGGDDRVTLRWDADEDALARELAAFLPADTVVTFVNPDEPLTLEVRDVEFPMPGQAGVDLAAEARARGAGDVRVHVPGLTYVDPTLRAAGTNVVVPGLDVAMTLAAGGAARVTVAGALRQGSSNGRIALEASVANAWRFTDGLPPAQWPPVDAQLELVGIPTTLVDAFVGPRGLVRRAVGDDVGLSVEARGAGVSGGSLRMELRAPRASVSFAGRVENGTLSFQGDDHLGASLTLPAEWLRGELAAFLPSGTELTWPGAGAEVAITARELSVPLPTESFDLARTLEGTKAALQVRLTGVGVRNDATRAAKLDVGLRDVVLDARVAPGASATVSLVAAMTPGANARLAVEAQVPRPFAVVTGAPLAPITARVECQDVETASIDAFLGSAVRCSELLGARVSTVVSLRDAATGADGPSGAFALDLNSERATARATGTLAGGKLTCRGDEGVDVSIRLAPDFVARESTARLPAGTRVQLAEGAEPLIATLRDVEFTLPVSTTPTTPATALSADPAVSPSATSATSEPTSAASNASAVLDLVAGLALKLDVRVPAIVYADASTDAAQRPIQLRDVRLASTWSPTALPFARVSATIVDEPAGTLTADVSALDPLVKLTEPAGLDTWRARLDVRAAGVPTAILDALAGQGGLLVESLGPRVDVDVRAPDVSLSKGEVSAEMKSTLHSVTARGHFESRTFVVDQVDGVLASVGLGPVMSQRVVGKLVPTLVNVRKPEGATPARFAVDALRFPLDGDLRKLDGTVRIDLGDVSYSLFPKLESLLGDGTAGAKSLKVPALTVPIRKGVAGYERLPVKIGSREFVFSGTYDMVTDAAQLTANVPVKYLGKKVSTELEDLREYIDPELTLPLTIRGSLLNPSIGLDDGAFRKVLEDAGKRALEKAGGNLLDDLLKKKKKKKD